MHEPVNYRVKVDKMRQPSAIRLDENGCVVLSQHDVERIADALAKRLNPAPAVGASAIVRIEPPIEPERDYFPVRKNEPRRPASEY